MSNIVTNSKKDFKMVRIKSTLQKEVKKMRPSYQNPKWLFFAQLIIKSTFLLLLAFEITSHFLSSMKIFLIGSPGYPFDTQYT